MDKGYIGHRSQLCGVEEVRLVGGRGDGMRLLQVRNGKGLEFTVSADRCADISRLSFRGDNYSYIGVGGYAAPSYYSDKGDDWLKTFTCGLLTTCGLDATGSPCVDEGEETPLHGRIGNQPAEHIFWDEDEDTIRIKARVTQAVIFGRKLTLEREYTVSKTANTIDIRDAVTNDGDQVSPLMVLYHMNIGYPLLSEDAELFIPAATVTPRNEFAAEGLADWAKVIPPVRGIEEQCYYHSFDGPMGLAAIYNRAIDKGLVIRFDTGTLDHFVQWKMMGYRDYVMGLEPGNCLPEGRDVDRKNGILKFIQPGETVKFHVQLSMVEGEAQWAQVKV